ALGAMAPPKRCAHNDERATSARSEERPLKRGRTAAAGLLAMSWLLASAGASARPVASVPGAPHVVPTRIDMLKYYGGRVISNVEIVEVFWGPNVDPTLTAQIGAFYTALVKSSYVDWLSEYDTIGKT